LHAILETKRKEVEALHDRSDLGELKERARDAPRARNFFSAVTKNPRRTVNLIAEIKKASPSAGTICEDFEPRQIARRYVLAGADALSVLTDEKYFQGSLDHMRAVRDEVDLPVLRKDFIIDEYQVYESRCAGADAILLIAAALPGGKLLDLMILAREMRMTSLVEVHGADELLKVRSAIGFPHRAYSLLGINNRDLTSFQVDIGTTTRLAELAGEDVKVVSESGIRTREDVERVRAAGASAVLIGETLMRSDDVAKRVEELLGPAS